MESSALFITLFLWFALLSLTTYFVYISFGPDRRELQDPFDELEE